MKAKNILSILTMLSIGSSCCLFPVVPGYTQRVVVGDNARKSCYLHVSTVSRNELQKYIECIEITYSKYSRKHYVRNSSNKISTDPGAEVFYISSAQNRYIDTPEKASPYNYGDVVNHISTLFSEIDDPERTRRFLRDLASIQYEQCGKNVYTIEERCAALAAVDIRPDWCKKGF